MGNAASCKLATPKVAQLKGAVNQLVVVAGQIVAEALLVDFDGLQAGSRQPSTAFDGGQCQCMGHVFKAMHSQAQTGAIEKTTLSIQPCRAHRAVKGIHLITQLQGFSSLALNVPLALVVLMHGNCFAGL